MMLDFFFNDASPRHGDWGHCCWEGCEVWGEEFDFSWHELGEPLGGEA